MSKLFLFIALCFAAALQGVNVVAISGSTRADSVNKKLLLEASKMARQMGAAVTVVDLNEYAMPFYDGDLEAKEAMPPAAIKLQKLLAGSQVILIASPEYNRSLPAVLKNTLDWVSREKLHGLTGDAFKGKRFVLLSASPGGRGGAGGLNHVRDILQCLGGTVVQEQFCLPNAYSQFDAEGNLKAGQAKEQLQAFMHKAIQ